MAMDPMTLQEYARIPRPQPIKEQIERTICQNTVSIFADSDSPQLQELLDLFADEENLVLVKLDEEDPNMYETLASMTTEAVEDYFVFVGNTMYVSHKELLERKESGALHFELLLAEMRL